MSMGTIRATAATLVGTALGSDFKPLEHQFEVERNNDRALEAGYAVNWGEATEFLGPKSIDQCINILQDLSVIITRKVWVGVSDEKLTASIDTLYSAVETIIKAFITGRLGIPATIQEVRLDGVSAPKPFDNGRDIFSIELKFNVRYLLT